MARCAYAALQNMATEESKTGSGGDSDKEPVTLRTVSMLDDSLGALDASTANKVFDGLFGYADQGRDEGVLRSGGGVVWVTHAVHFLPRPEISRILVLDTSGGVQFYGTWPDLLMKTNGGPPASSESSEPQSLSPSPSSQQLMDLVASAEAPNEEENDEGEDDEGGSDGGADDIGHLEGSGSAGGALSVTSVAVDLSAAEGDGDGKGEGTAPQKQQKQSELAGSVLVREEEREVGVASLKTWRQWVAAAGGGVFLSVQFLTLALDRMSYVACEWWLAKWCSAVNRRVVVGVGGLQDTMPSQDEEGSAWAWSRPYFCLGALSVLFCFLRTHWGLQGGITAAKRLHHSASQRVLMAPMAFYDATPTGRLLNRLSFDTEVLDIVMTQKATVSLVAMGWTVTGFVISTFRRSVRVRPETEAVHHSSSPERAFHMNITHVPSFS